jgi:hypothetical protein
MWNQPPADALVTLSCKSHIARKRVRKVIINEEKWRVFEAWWWNVQKWREAKNWEWSDVKWSEELRWNVCIIIRLYLCSCMQVLCAMLSHYYLPCYFVITGLMFFYYSFLFLYFIVCLFSVLCILCFCIFCVFFLLLYAAVSFLFCTSLPTTLRWRHPRCVIR